MSSQKISTITRIRHVLGWMFIGAALTVVSPSFVTASELPIAARSPLVGFTFSDKPLQLPVESNFQTAMQTASKEVGRSCNAMEAYGWKMRQSEQHRVNKIFNATVERLRTMGYSVESKAPGSLSNDVTLFTADRPEKHFMFMWSAGEVGLVMVLCETPAPPASSVPLNKSISVVPLLETYPVEVVKAEETKQELTRPKNIIPYASREITKEVLQFTPIGNWVGSYTCGQGYTGGSLEIKHMKGKNFEGLFRFYPTHKNPHVPPGSYTVTGQYDRDTQRILINPKKWVVRPKDFYNTVLVGIFDPEAKTFSAYFQGVTGCTSFEARLEEKGHKGTTKKVSRRHHARPLTKNSTEALSKLPVLPPTPANVPPLVNPAVAPAPGIKTVIAPEPEITVKPAPAAASVPKLPIPPPPVAAPVPPSSTALPSNVDTPSSIVLPSATPAPQP